MPERKSKPLPGNVALAKVIEQRLAEKPGMTQASVAERSKLSYESVNKYVRGQVAPSYARFMQLARGLELKPKELMARLEDEQGADAAAGDADADGADAAADDAGAAADDAGAAADDAGAAAGGADAAQ